MKRWPPSGLSAPPRTRRRGVARETREGSSASPLVCGRSAVGLLTTGSDSHCSVRPCLDGTSVFPGTVGAVVAPYSNSGRGASHTAPSAMRKPLSALPFSSPSKVQLQRRYRRQQMARVSPSDPSASATASGDPQKAEAIVSPMSCTTGVATKRMTPRRRARLTGSARLPPTDLMLPPTDICSPVRLSLPTFSPGARTRTALREAAEALEYHKQNLLHANFGAALSPRFTSSTPSRSPRSSLLYDSSSPIRLSPLSPLASASQVGGQKAEPCAPATRRLACVAALLLLVLVSAGCGALAALRWAQPAAAARRHVARPGPARAGLTRQLLLPPPPAAVWHFRWRSIHALGSWHALGS